MLALALLALSLTGGFYFWERAHPPKLPAIKLDGVDPAIVRVVEESQARVRQSFRSGAAWGNLGMILSIHDFLAEADTCFANAERFDPQEPRWPYLRGLSRSGNDALGALPSLERAADLCGNLPAPHLRLAELLIEQGKLETAGSQIRLVLAGDPRNARALLGLGRIALAQGRLAESRDYLQQSIQYAPDVRASRSLLANVQQRLGDSAGANESLRAAVTLPEKHIWPDPYLVEINRLRTGVGAATDDADTWLKTGKCREAAALLQETTRDYPGNMKAWLLLGRAWKQCTNYAAAENALRRAIEIEPASAEARVEYGIVLYAQAKYSEAEANYREAIRIQPNLAEAWFNLGLCLMGQQDAGGALEAFQTALRHKPDMINAYVEVGRSLAKQGHIIEARGLMRHAVQLNPSHAAAQKLLQELEKSSVTPKAPKAE